MCLPWGVAAAWRSVSIHRLYGQEPAPIPVAGRDIIKVLAADEKRCYLADMCEKK
jgi:hypothetical protein